MSMRRGVFWLLVFTVLVTVGGLWALSSALKAQDEPVHHAGSSSVATSTSSITPSPTETLPSNTSQPTPSVEVKKEKVRPRGNPTRLTATHKGKNKPYLDAPIRGDVGITRMWLYKAWHDVVNPSPTAVQVFNEGVWDIKPGEPGPSVLAGHISRKGKPGTLWGLQNTRPSDTFVVTYDTGDTVVSIAQKPLTPDKVDLPVKEIWRDKPEPIIWVITCNPNSDAGPEGYEGNVLVKTIVTEVIRAK